MPNFADEIVDFSCDAYLEIERTVDGVPETLNVDQAWLIIKREHLDDDAAAVLSLAVTTVESLDGVVADPGNGDGTAVVQFFLSPTELAPLGEPHWFAIRLQLTDGRVYTSNAGVIRGLSGLFRTTPPL